MNPFDAWRHDLMLEEELTADIIDRIRGVHGDRADRALKGLAEDRVKQYNDFTVVVGHRDEYIIEAQSCTCEDYQYNLDPEDPTDQCWHVIAAEIADILDEADTYNMWYADMRDFI